MKKNILKNTFATAMLFALIATAYSADDRHTYYGVDIETSQKHGEQYYHPQETDATEVSQYKSCLDRPDDIYCEKIMYQKSKPPPEEINLNDKMKNKKNPSKGSGKERQRGLSNKANFSEKKFSISDGGDREHLDKSQIMIIAIFFIFIALIIIYYGQDKKLKRADNNALHASKNKHPGNKHNKHYDYHHKHHEK